MQKKLFFLLVVAVMLMFFSCSNTPEKKDTPTVSATEIWGGDFIFPTGAGSGSLTLKKMSDSSYDSSGNVSAGPVFVPFKSTKTTISGNSISITGSGTSTNTAYSLVSAFTITVSGSVNGGSGSGTFVVAFSDPTWGTNSGNWTATRTNGNGVTP